MPELPEVHAKKRYFDATALHQKIRAVEVKDAYILKDIAAEDFASALTGRQFTSTYRRGKYLFADLDDEKSVLLHFGMSGRLKYYADEEDQPKFERIRFELSDGFKLGFDCPRKFARIRLLDSRAAYIKEKGLGADATELSEADFLKLTEGKTGSIKGFLLKQEYLAGIGNLYADEICYQTKIHPNSSVNALSEEQCKDIYQKMQSILAFALEKNATYSEYPSNWFWHHREEGGNSPDESGTIEKEKIAGRSTYFVPNRQLLYTQSI
ncbi:MAG: DNA-formamidopyrimidine glycosylase family protein [Bacteroidota bacterium]